jgi:glutamate racemase
MGENVTLIDSAKQVAIEVKNILIQENILNKGSRHAKHRFYVSDNPEWFCDLAKRFLGEPIKEVKRVNDDTTYGAKRT